MSKRAYTDRDGKRYLHATRCDPEADKKESTLRFHYNGKQLTNQEAKEHFFTKKTPLRLHQGATDGEVRRILTEGHSGAWRYCDRPSVTWKRCSNGRLQFRDGREIVSYGEVLDRIDAHEKGIAGVIKFQNAKTATQEGKAIEEFLQKVREQKADARGKPIRRDDACARDARRITIGPCGNNNEHFRFYRNGRRVARTEAHQQWRDSQWKGFMLTKELDAKANDALYEAIEAYLMDDDIYVAGDEKNKACNDDGKEDDEPELPEGDQRHKLASRNEARKEKQMKAIIKAAEEREKSRATGKGRVDWFARTVSFFG